MAVNTSTRDRIEALLRAVPGVVWASELPRPAASAARGDPTEPAPEDCAWLRFRRSGRYFRPARQAARPGAFPGLWRAVNMGKLALPILADHCGGGTKDLTKLTLRAIMYIKAISWRSGNHDESRCP